MKRLFFIATTLSVSIIFGACGKKADSVESVVVNKFDCVKAEKADRACAPFFITVAPGLCISGCVTCYDRNPQEIEGTYEIVDCATRQPIDPGGGGFHVQRYNYGDWQWGCGGQCMHNNNPAAFALIRPYLNDIMKELQKVPGLLPCFQEPVIIGVD